MTVPDQPWALQACSLSSKSLPSNPIRLPLCTQVGLFRMQCYAHLPEMLPVAHGHPLQSFFSFTERGLRQM